MRVQLFGTGTRGQSRAITAQRKVNCFLEPRDEEEKTRMAIIGLPGPTQFVALQAGPSTRGMWAVNGLATPAVFLVQWNTLWKIDAVGNVDTIGTIMTATGDVSMVDDGKFLMLVDGVHGWYYDMQTPGTLTKITDGNFTTTPTTVTWQDTYFIVTSNAVTRQFQLSDNADPSTWPSVNINFAGSGGGKIRAGIADHSALILFGDSYTEFWQNSGGADFPYSKITGATQQFGLAAAWSMSTFDNSVAGLFRDNDGNIIVAKLNGFALQRISDGDIDTILQGYVQNGVSLRDAQGYSFAMLGHSFYVLNLPTAEATFMYDARSKIWTELESLDGTYFHEGVKCATLQGMPILGADNDGIIYRMVPGTFYKENPLVGTGNVLWPMEVTSKHIWNDDKYIGIELIEVDIESGVGLQPGVSIQGGAATSGEDPQLDLQVSKDGGNTFYSAGFASMGRVGEYTQRLRWNSLGAARDWVLRLRVTDPVKRVILGASMEMKVNSF